MYFGSRKLYGLCALYAGHDVTAVMWPGGLPRP